MGSAAAACVGKLLDSQSNLDSLNMLTDLLNQILMHQSSRDIIKIFNLIINAVNEKVKAIISEILKANDASLINCLLLFIAQENSNSSDFESLLVSSDEFIALEAFSLLTRDTIKKRRKPAESISKNDLRLFQKFIDDVCFSGSVEFRQKTSVSAKSFFDQIYARIYYLIRELSKKPQLELKSDDSAAKNEVQITIDHECLNLELNILFDWLGKFVKDSLVEPFDFRHSNFGSAEFAFAQIISLFSAFDGNATLVAANPHVLSCIASRFQSSVVDFALIPSVENLIECVAKSTYDKLRLQAIEIICKCEVDASAICLEKYAKDLEHPRAINNEGAARIVQLHARLANSSQIEAVLNELLDRFMKLKSDFPTSLRGNNINGRLLLLRYLIEDQHAIGDEVISKIIDLSIEISTFVSEIASHPSPEGLNISAIESFNNDEDEDDAESCRDEFDDHHLNSQETSVSSQYVLSFSWRAIKETSSLIESLVKKHSGIVANARLHSISDHFISLLLTLRHCGAFRALQKPLSTTLRLGYSFAEKAELLQHVLDVCLGTGQINTTRRSAGLPFLILAIAHSCSSHSNELENLLANIFLPLLKAANDRNESSNEIEVSSSLSPSVIHAFNIIRSLVRDSRISSEMGRHMASVAKLCLESFNSVHWNVRNASAMLFSSLISRIFGPKYVNDFSVNEHNVDLREIEVKFEGMIRVLTSYFLQVETKELDPKFAYPLLAVLERIKIPPNERYAEFRSVIVAFIARLLEKLENQPENGRKLVHVLGRTVFSLLNSKSLRIEEIHAKVLMSAPKSTPNGIYNIIVILGNIKNFYSNSLFVDLLPPIQMNWHPILISKYEQLISHKSELVSNFREQSGSPVRR